VEEGGGARGTRGACGVVPQPQRGVRLGGAAGSSRHIVDSGRLKGYSHEIYPSFLKEKTTTTRPRPIIGNPVIFGEDKTGVFVI
jgi:hypothetical protein